MKQVNWNAVVRALLDKGMTKQEIAAAAGRTEKAIDSYRWAGKEPAHNVGERIVNLARKRGIKVNEL